MRMSIAYADWLNTQQWDYFTILTYKWDVNEKENRRNMDRMINTIDNKVDDFNMFWVSEWHKSGTSTHNHLLLRGDVKHLINAYWKSSNLGDSKFIKHIDYDISKGANYYICKYIDKNVDYDYV